MILLTHFPLSFKSSSTADLEELVSGVCFVDLDIVSLTFGNSISCNKLREVVSAAYEKSKLLKVESVLYKIIFTYSNWPQRHVVPPGVCKVKITHRYT